MTETKELIYQKCSVDGDNGKVTEWLPEKIAVTGRSLRLLTPKGWQGGYKVGGVLGERKTLAELPVPLKRYAPVRDYYVGENAEV